MCYNPCMGYRLARHRSSTRWINTGYDKDFKDDGCIKAQLKKSRWGSLRGYRRVLHKKQKRDKRERREKQKWFSSSEYKLKRIRYEKRKIADGHDLR